MKLGRSILKVKFLRPNSAKSLSELLADLYGPLSGSGSPRHGGWLVRSFGRKIGRWRSCRSAGLASCGAETV